MDDYGLYLVIDPLEIDESDGEQITQVGHVGQLIPGTKKAIEKSFPGAIVTRIVDEEAR